MAQPQSVRPQSPRSYETGQSTTISSRNPTDWSVGWSSLFWGCALVMAANLFLWIWDYKFAFTAGLNSASPEFSLYFRSLFWGELISLGILTGPCSRWLILPAPHLPHHPYPRPQPPTQIPA